MLNASQGQHGTLWGQLQALHRSLPTNHSQKNHMLLMLSPWSQSGVGEIQTDRLVNIHHFSVKCRNTKSTWEQQWSNQEKEEKLVPVSQSLKFRHLQHCVLGSGARGTEGCLIKKQIPGLHHRPTGSEVWGEFTVSTFAQAFQLVFTPLWVDHSYYELSIIRKAILKNSAFPGVNWNSY